MAVIKARGLVLHVALRDFCEGCAKTHVDPAVYQAAMADYREQAKGEPAGA